MNSGIHRQSRHFVSSIHELATGDNFDDGGGDFAVAGSDGFRYFGEEFIFAREDTSAQRVAEKLAAEMVRELGVVFREVIAESVHALEPGAVAQFTGVIDDSAGLVGGTKASDRIKGLEGETKRVDAVVTDSTGLVFAVFQKCLTQRSGLQALLEFGNVWRRRWRAVTEDDGVEEFSAQDGTGAVRSRGFGQDRPHAKAGAYTHSTLPTNTTR